MQRRWVALAGAMGAVCVALVGYGARSASPVVNSTVAIVDPYAPAQQAGVDSSGNLKVAISGALTANQSVNIAQVAGATVATGNGTAAGTLRVALPTDGTGVVQPGNTANTTPWLVTTVPASSGSCTPYHLAGGTAASTNATNIKASAGVLCHLTAINTTATVYYLRMYNLASAPTCSSATGAVHTYPVLPSGGINIPLPAGETYSTGIGFCVTGGGADTDNTNAATGVFIEGSYR